MSDLVVVAMVGAIVPLAGLFGFYALCAYIVRQTGGTTGLRDLGVAVGSFLGARSSSRSTAATRDRR